MHEFKHPKYYKELRDAGNELAKRDAVKEDLARPGSSPARNKSDQVISNAEATAASERAPGPGLKVSSHKLQAPSVKLSNQPVQSPSGKHQALSNKRQAPSHKLQAP